MNYILELSHNRNFHIFTNQKSKYLFYQKKVKINLDSIIQLSATEFLVPSETIADKLYKVDMETSLCKCPQGFLKGPCKHKGIVSHTFKLRNFETLPQQNEKMRAFYYFLGTGGNRDVSWFRPMEINATNGLLADIFELNKELEKENVEVSTHEEDEQDGPPSMEEFSSHEEICHEEASVNIDAMEGDTSNTGEPKDEDHTARGGADWTLPLAVPDKGQADIRQFLKAGCTKPGFGKIALVKIKEEPFDKMRMIRNKMAESRRAADRDLAKESKVKEPPMKMWDGEEIIYARDVDNARVQDHQEVVVVGADVEALYPNLVDIEIANICYEAIIKSGINFNNINFKKALLYLAINMNKTDQRTSPLWRILPRRTSKAGVRPGVTASPENEEHWYFPPRELTGLEKRMVVAMVVKVGVLVMMNTHVYSWNGESFLQKAGGPIGLRSTCAVARVVMNEWDARWMEVCKKNNIKLSKSNRYMDDIRSFLKALKLGWRWVGGNLCYTKSWEQEDRASGISASRRTALILVAIMNDIFPFLNFTIELGEDFVDGKLPSLDISIWVVGGRTILYEFFEKTMASNLMVEAGSALSKDVKLATLSEEVARRLRNTSVRLDSSRRLEIVERACTKMKTSGHSEEFIRLAVEQGIRSFDAKMRRSLLEIDNPGYQPLFPTAGWKRNIKSKEKAMKRATWFRGKENEDEDDWNPLPLSKSSGRVSKKKKIFRKVGKSKPKSSDGNATVVFVPSTRGGILIQSLKDEEDTMAEITGFRVKYQEAGGSILANAFNKNLGSGQTCGRADCPPCIESDGKVDCKAKSIVYESKCLVCNPKTSHEEADDHEDQPSETMNTPREGIYVGESSRSLHERAIEHVRDAKSFSAKSHIVKHWMTAHPTLPNPPEVGFTITGRFKDCLSRQISEALRINLSKDILLNSKGEYGNNCISRLSVQEDAWERRERSRLEEEQEEVNKRNVEEFKRLKCVQYTPIPPSGKHTAGGEQTGHYPGSHCSPPPLPLGPSGYEYEYGENMESTHEVELCPAQVTSTKNNRQKMSWANVPQPEITSKNIGQKISWANVPQSLVTQNNWQKMSRVNVPQPVVITSELNRQKMSWANEPQPYSPSINRQKISWPKVAQPDRDIPALSLLEEDTVSQPGPDGGGSVNTLTGTLCNNVETLPFEGETIMESRTEIMYETDEEEFMERVDTSPAVKAISTATRQFTVPGKTKYTAKRILSTPRVARPVATANYNLAYFNLWWSRMAVEGRKEAKELRRLEEDAKKAKLRRKFVKTKRLNDDVSQHQDAGASGNSRQFVSGLFEPNWRGGQTCEGGKAEQGVGGGEGVPPDDIYIYERPQSLQENFERFKYGTSDNKTLYVEMDSLAPDFSVQKLGVDGGKLKVRVAGS